MPTRFNTSFRSFITTKHKKLNYFYENIENSNDLKEAISDQLAGKSTSKETNIAFGKAKLKEYIRCVPKKQISDKEIQQELKSNLDRIAKRSASRNNQNKKKKGL